MTVGDMLSRISSAELTEWMAYDAIDPFGEQRADFRAGIVAATTANHSFAPPREARRASDFMMFADKRDEAADGILLDDPAEQAKLIKRIIDPLGSKDP
jgi:hypothetical protein